MLSSSPSLAGETLLWACWEWICLLVCCGWTAALSQMKQVELPCSPVGPLGAGGPSVEAEEHNTGPPVSWGEKEEEGAER